jgi:cell division initiation protein
MKLSALDIRKQEFAKVFRGYDPEEVDSFRHMLSQQWHLLTEDVRRLEQRIHDQSEKLEHYRKVEEALEEALQSAREGAKERLEQAERRAQTAVHDAEAKSEAIIQRSEQRAQRMLAEAEELRRQARRTYAEATLRRNEMVKRLRSLLASELELLENFETTEDQRARMDPVDEGEDLAPTSFAAGSVAAEVDDEFAEPEYGTGEPEVEPEEEEAFDIRDMADLEAEPVEVPEGGIDEDSGDDTAHDDGPEPEASSPEEPEDEPFEAEDEIRKIRRILEDLDG